MAPKDNNLAKQEAMEFAEEAREAFESVSFVEELFMGRLRPDLLFPFPEQDPEDKKIGDALLTQVEKFMREQVNADQIDQTGVMPETVLQGLAAMGLFGMKIPAEYGGMGLSQTNYNRIIALIGSYCGSTAVWLSAHQSIGVPQPLKLFGTEEQKKKYLPLFAKGSVSAFALTEPNVGSDPAKMETTATPTEDGESYLINGEKLWCTNGTAADIIVVMARTPSIFEKGREKKQITAFIVETKTPGFEVVHRCDFMGLKGIANGLLRFRNVKVPKENILWGLGKGLRLALTTLNTGRLTLPAACTAAAKKCLEVTRDWAGERVQWGQPIGKHEAVAAKTAAMSSQTFAMEAVSLFASGLADQGGHDIRLEAAIAKLFCSESGWKIVDDTLQIRGGRGYETASSLRARGEKGYAIERMMRDYRINTLIEGSSEIMRLVIAREALDVHFGLGMPLFNPRTPLVQKIRAAVKMIGFYLQWYPRQWLYWGWWPRYHDHSFAKYLRFTHRASHRLARSIFHAMGRYQLGLERKQQLLGRVVNIGVDLFVMLVTLSRAEALLKKEPSDQTPLLLANHFCRHAMHRIKSNFRHLFAAEDKLDYQVALSFLDGKFEWLEDGVIKSRERSGLVT